MLSHMCNKVEDKFLKPELLARGKCIHIIDLLPRCPLKELYQCVFSPAIFGNICFLTYSLSNLTRL